MFERNREEMVNALVQQAIDNLSPPDTRADYQIQPSSDNIEMDVVMAKVRNAGGETRWNEDGAFMAQTNNKVALFAIVDLLDEDDTVYDYEVYVMETQLNGVVSDVSDEVDIDDVRDMNNMFFKIYVYMDPSVVQFDDTYVDINNIIGTETGDEYDFDVEYVNENLKGINEYITWKGGMNERYFLFEKKVDVEDEDDDEIDLDESKILYEMHVVPPKATDGEVYFDINKFNVEAAEDNGIEKKFQDMGYTITNLSKLKQIDYEMDGRPKDVIIYDIEGNHADSDDNIVISESLNTFTEATIYSDRLTEIRRKIKFNSRGQKRIKMQCRKGFKYDTTRRVCVKISGGDMMKMKRAHIKANRTVKAAGQGHKLRKVRKMRKANRFRKASGTKNTPMF